MPVPRDMFELGKIYELRTPVDTRRQALLIKKYKTTFRVWLLPEGPMVRIYPDMLTLTDEEWERHETE